MESINEVLLVWEVAVEVLETGVNIKGFCAM
jgi:hypothetical protein